MARRSPSMSPAYRSGTTTLANAMDNVAKRKPLAEQLGALRAQVERCDRQLVTLRVNGRHERAVRVEQIRSDAVAKAQLVADRLAKGMLY